METKICTKCKQDKELKHFTYRYDRKKYRNECKDCLSRDARIRRNGGEMNGFKPRSVNPDARYNSDITKINAFKLDPKPNYCDYKLCRCLLPQKEHLIKVHNGKTLHFCDEWCLENEMIKYQKIHKCKRCENETCPIRNKRNGCIAGWRKLCDDCLENKNYSKKNSLVNKGEIGNVLPS